MTKLLKKFGQSLGALAIALVIAIIIRQSWFELYEIPTGSMRPTFREQDHLTVTKTQFGINVPLQTQHFYFDPDLVQRSSIIIFSGDKLPALDSDGSYFGIVPFTKRYVKRMIGKPGDTLYFYGGLIYGYDKDGNEIKDLGDTPYMAKIEHIPFINFEGRMVQKGPEIEFLQMNQLMGKGQLSPLGIQGTLDENKWGMQNFAMAKLEKKDKQIVLKLRHHPGQPKLFQQNNSIGINLETEKSEIPLQQKQIDALMQNMYTARFVVKNGIARRYSVEERSGHEGIRLGGVPDGTYEFYFGKAYEVGFGGILSELPKSHPLYNQDLLVKLYNQGVNFDPAYETDYFAPNRYAYYRDGSLYLLGAPIFTAEDLKAFTESEKSKAKPFIDTGKPSKEEILAHGLKIPEKNYLVLGDNHAMSADSRVFGFVPEDNLQGAPVLLMWPPGERLGYPEQNPYPTLVTPRIIIWIIAAIAGAIWYAIHRYRKKWEEANKN